MITANSLTDWKYIFTLPTTTYSEYFRTTFEHKYETVTILSSQY